MGNSLVLLLIVHPKPRLGAAEKDRLRVIRAPLKNALDEVEAGIIPSHPKQPVLLARLAECIGRSEMVRWPLAIVGDPR